MSSEGLLKCFWTSLRISVFFKYMSNFSFCLQGKFAHFSCLWFCSFYEEPVNYPPKHKIFVCCWMTLSTNVLCQHWAIEGQNLLTSLIRNFARILPKFQLEIKFRWSCIIFVNRSECTVRLNTQKGKKALGEINATSFRIFRFSNPLLIMNYLLSISICSLVSNAFIYMCFGQNSYDIIFSFERDLYKG